MQRLLISIVAFSFLSFSACKNRENINSQDKGITDIAEVSKYAFEINSLVKTYLKATTEEEKIFVREKAWNLILSIEAKGSTLLHKVVEKVVTAVPRANAETVELVYNTIRVQIDNNSRFTPWDDIDKNQFVSMKASKIDFSDQNSIDAFANELETLGRTTFLKLEPASNLKINGLPADSNGSGKFLSLFIDGKPSWLKRHDLMMNAKKSIWISSWAFYDDDTGIISVEKLVELKRTKNLDIKVMVDGPVSEGKWHNAITQKLADGGIEVVRWSRRPKLLGFGMHRKIMTIDHETSDGVAIFGGKNFGDNYSSLKPALNAGATADEIKADTLSRWRDTDMAVTGAPVQQAAHYFSVAWNQYCTEINPKSCKSITNDPGLPAGASNSPELFAFIDHDPTNYLQLKSFSDPIYLATMKMIKSARSEILLSNAYFILTSPMKNALVEAMKRGVKVKVHTNSDSSMDVADKPLLRSIYRGVLDVLKPNKENFPAPYATSTVYLQKDRTLHSKYIVIDRKVGWIGSYNIHPRSSRYESEMVGMFLGEKAGAEVAEMFNDDTTLSKADAVSDPNSSMLKLPESQLLDVIEPMIFEQL